MLFYDIEFNTIPKIKYNCAVSSLGYRTSIGKNDSLLELCFIDNGGCVVHSQADTLVCEAGHIYPLIFKDDCEIYIESDSPVKMYSVGIECNFSLKIIDSAKISEKDMRSLMKNLLSGNRFLLPKQGFSIFEYDWIIPYMKKMMVYKTTDKIGEETNAISTLLEFLSRVTKASMDAVAFDAKAFPTSAVAYSEMVISYITKNYRRKISVSEIAEEFGLTPNYIHAIFKQVKGMTIIEYLNNYRMNLAKIYIERFGLHAYEAANMVGIDDPAYFSRVFKKLYGKSVSEFKRKGDK